MKFSFTPTVAKSSNSNVGQPLSKRREPLVPGMPSTSLPMFVPRPGCSEFVTCLAHPKCASMRNVGLKMYVPITVVRYVLP